MTLQHALLSKLADGRFHSGDALGRELGVSRTAVWKALRDCESLGLVLQAVRGRGYRLAGPIELLDEQVVRCQLNEESRRLLAQLSLHEQIDSTNNWLLAQDRIHAHAVLAEYQHAGRGRRGRDWLSPYAANVYLSLGWVFPGGPASLAGLSLATGVAVARALAGLGIRELGLKWPNDLYLGGAKLGGILLELRGEQEGPCEAVAGIGLNVRMPREEAAAIEQPWTDLSVHAGDLSRNTLVARLLDELMLMFESFSDQGFVACHDEWQALDIFRGREVVLETQRSQVRGVARGVDSRGALLLENTTGLQRFHAGEVSLRGG
ncbi:MAG: bifunctional biotin--[acetyl-CoA-carboxylase] ligase/biotin operon repressor BirA [Granulosicoccaceae bacterium]|jgi:BirA family biotin operon repressor/biotin-[acetyl-CoA-carboxylase] ligase